MTMTTKRTLYSVTTGRVYGLTSADVARLHHAYSVGSTTTRPNGDMRTEIQTPNGAYIVWERKEG